MSTDLDVLRKHGRTFYLASFLLPEEARADAARLYHFCRVVDDLADEDEDFEAIADIQAQLRGEVPPDGLALAMLELEDRRQLSVDALLHLIDGVVSDQGAVRVQDDGELLRYCYRVAGTVGLAMCAVLGVTDPRAQAHAIDLGIAMQLTNICRDVLEDQQRDRRYIPATRPDVKQAVRALLEMSEHYYASARAGLPYIPWRARGAIAVAMMVYRQIGVRLLRKGGDPMQGRTIVPLWEKLAVGAWALVSLPFTRRAPHPASLHGALQGLPGCAT